RGLARCAALGVDLDALISMNQTHSASVMTVGAEGADRPRVDAMVTAAPGLALTVLHADCAPVLFADARNGVIGAAHAGWRGAAGGIIEATLEAMGAIGAARSSTVAVIGPTIAHASYEVGPDFPVPIVTALPAAADFFTPSKRYGHHMFDLPGYILMRLEAAGVGETQNIDIDTYADEERFFSYRRNTHRGETDYGRLLSAIVLEG
ncbi:MAG: peptidoglycan editing factor PgeF, partial [Pseudomonadota bacterium]